MIQKRKEEREDMILDKTLISSGKCLVHNMNFLIEEYDLDLRGDEKSWVAASYGEAGAGTW